MKKSKFVKATFILLIGGIVTKILGMIIRIVITRLLGTEGMGIYMLIMPTFTLLIGIAQLGLPVAISKLVAEDKSNNKNLIFSTIPIITIVNTIIIIIVLLSSKFIANNLLHEPRSYYALICVSLVLPFISISSIIRGYFFGRQKMFPHVLSNIVEDITRLIILIIGIPATLFFLLFPELPLKIIYNTTSGINYLKVLAPICLLYYIQSPLTSSLQAMGKAKCAMQGTLWGMIIRTIVLIIGSVMKIGLYGLVLATASNIIYITVHHIIYVKKYLK